MYLHSPTITSRFLLGRPRGVHIRSGGPRDGDHHVVLVDKLGHASTCSSIPLTQETECVGIFCIMKFIRVRILDVID